ncbi:MAG: lipopolysaccharide assembly protein LapA domain-containing protein [Paracoccaceae bacterium]
MRILKLILLGLLAVVAVILAIANRGLVALHVWPDGMPLPEPMASWPNDFEMPIYLAILAAVFVGVVIGLTLEMLRESTHRREERRYRSEAARLYRENKELRAKLGQDPEDDVLGLEHA